MPLDTTLCRSQNGRFRCLGDAEDVGRAGRAGPARRAHICALHAPVPLLRLSVSGVGRVLVAGRGGCLFHTVFPTSPLPRFVAFGTVFGLLTKFELGRRLLLRFPRLFSYGVFSRAGPTEAQIRGTWFEYLHVAHGYGRGRPESPGQEPDEHRALLVRGPEPGYVACSIFVTQAAYVILEEEDKLAGRAGVLTPGTLLQGTDYVERLRSRGIVVKEVPVPE